MTDHANTWLAGDTVSNSSAQTSAFSKGLGHRFPQLFSDRLSRAAPINRPGLHDRITNVPSPTAEGTGGSVL